MKKFNGNVLLENLAWDFKNKLNNNENGMDILDWLAGLISVITFGIVDVVMWSKRCN